MSLTWRERLRRAQKRIGEQLDLTQQDWNFIWENIGSFCSLSDERIREVLEGEGKPLTQEEVDKLVEEMPQYQFDEMTKDVILEILEKLGYVIKKKQKKKQSKTDEEKESESDSDSDSDSDAEGDDVEETQEQEEKVENK